MELSAHATVGGAYGQSLAHVASSVEVSELSTGKREELLPEDIDALQTRATKLTQEIKEKIHAEIERYRPAALARAERLAHEKAASGDAT